MMKLAWICYIYDYDRNYKEVPVILFEEPDRYRYERVIPIVYAILEKNDE